MKTEVRSLETQVKDLRVEVEAYRSGPSREYPPEPLSAQFSEESLPELEYQNPKKKPTKGSYQKDRSFS